MFEYLKTLIGAYLPRHPKSEKGQDLAEYALLIGLIALIVFAAVELLGTSINDIFNGIAAEISSWGIPT